MKDRTKMMLSFVMLLMITGIIGFSYALFTTSTEKKGALNIIVGDVSCPIQSNDLENNQVTLQGGEEKEITVTFTNQSLVDIHSIITYSGSNNIEVLSASSNESEIELQNLATGTTLTYTLKLKNNGTSSETVTLNGRCGLSNKELALNEGETKITGTYEALSCEDMPQPNVPKLVEGMIPVKWDQGKSSWVKADSTNNDKSWYNYCNQEWANAVTVKETGTQQRSDYVEAEVGEKIDIEDINTMWVWIPRYEYDYVDIKTAGGTNSGSSSSPKYLNPGEIKIKFISKDLTLADEDNYIVHPAFDFGGEQLEGFWYGKFETSNKEQNCTPSTSGDVNTRCDLTTLTPQIKPSVTSWRGIRVSTAFTISQNMAKNTTEYGFSSDGSIDTHMSKNSEWGAVAYLSQSEYGKYGNDGEEVYINNCSSYTTGIAGATANASEDSGCANTYNTEAGQKASTTGNITGVYDMSGGALEYVMGALKDDATGKPTIKSSGFKTSGETNLIPDAKYYDLYTTNFATSCTQNGECYGHALSETKGWYSNTYSFVSSTTPWFIRGGYYLHSSSAGVFYYYYTFGSAYATYSFRLVLVNAEI